MDNIYIAIMIAVIAIVTIVLRFLPFWIFGGKRKMPKILLRLSNALPHAIMGMLVIYCMKSVRLTAFPYGLPELIAGAAVVLMHLWKKNTLLSVSCGTVLYMVLVQFIFA